MKIGSKEFNSESLQSIVCCVFNFKFNLKISKCFDATFLFTQPPREDQAGSAHTAKGAGPPHSSRGGVLRAWPKVLDGIQWTMTERSLASRLEAVCVYGVGEGGRGGCAVQ